MPRKITLFRDILLWKVVFFRFLFLGWISLSPAIAVELTIYDDGRSCPANCDAHVVFHPTMNGTPFAHHPQSSSPHYQKCLRSSLCQICFEQGDNECIEIMYRGSGPGRDTFDFTPAFYEEWCAKQNIPQKLSSKCSDLERTASSLDGRINCIKAPAHSRCTELMGNAKERKKVDVPMFEECLRMGEEEFNSTRSDSEKRIHGCAYEFEKNGGPNSNGLRWHRLLPGVCREGAYVGRDGLDCCSGNPFVDGSLGVECRVYYPVP